jgi:hypothetical protein
LLELEEAILDLVFNFTWQLAFITYQFWFWLTSADWGKTSTFIITYRPERLVQLRTNLGITLQANIDHGIWRSSIRFALFWWERIMNLSFIFYQYLALMDCIVLADRLESLMRVFDILTWTSIVLIIMRILPLIKFVISICIEHLIA